MDLRLVVPSSQVLLVNFLIIVGWELGDSVDKKTLTQASMRATLLWR